MAMTIVEATRSVVGGIDTHSQVHVAAALDDVGGLLGSESFAATPVGYAAALSWFEGFCTQASRLSRWTARIARPGATPASPIPSTPSKPLGRRCRARPAAGPRAGTAGSR